FRYIGRLGYYLEPALGCYYLRRRYYVHWLGRFLGKDPLRQGGENAYGYVRNAPTTATDPEGMFAPGAAACLAACIPAATSILTAMGICRVFEQRWPDRGESLLNCITDLLIGEEGEPAANKVGTWTFLAASATCLGCLAYAFRGRAGCGVQAGMAVVLYTYLCGFFNNAFWFCPYGPEVEVETPPDEPPIVPPPGPAFPPTIPLR
ncbi:MAG: RHS repeat-associated core domain-containing protein, partial [Armatimonadetes bacterium]|nr:RHS repeat-associated core domain-containing protein [Armatimonadota bacterium]